MTLDEKIEALEKLKENTEFPDVGYLAYMFGAVQSIEEIMTEYKRLKKFRAEALEYIKYVNKNIGANCSWCDGNEVATNRFLERWEGESA